MRSNKGVAGLALAVALVTQVSAASAQGHTADEGPGGATFVTGTVSAIEEATVTPPEDVVDGVLQGRGWRLKAGPSRWTTLV